MNSLSGRVSGLVFAGCLFLPGWAAGQVPGTLLHSIPPPAVGVQHDVQLGMAMAVDGNYTVTGRPYDGTGGGGSGIVKVFHSTTGALLFTLINPAPGKDGRFGASVAIQGTRLVVGANQDSSEASQAGRVYVYDLAGATPTVPVLTVRNPAPETRDWFGSAVAIDGDRLVVGAAHDHVAGKIAGSITVYHLAGATPTVPVMLMPNPSPDDYDEFGETVAISGTRIVAGARRDSQGDINQAGRAYVFDLTSLTPVVPVLTLQAPALRSGGEFGHAVAISGARVVVGALFDDAVPNNGSVVRIYDLAGATPEVAVLTLLNPNASSNGWDYFGWSVSLSGNRVAVGAPQQDVPLIPDQGLDRGRAWVFDLSSNTPGEPVFTITNPAGGMGHFSESLALSGDTLVAGVPGDDNEGNNTGRAYIFNLAGAEPGTPAVTIKDHGPGKEDHFGDALAVSGNLMVVGASRTFRPGSENGAAYVYDLSGSLTTPIVTLDSPDFQKLGFGRAVAISGSRVVVGAPSFCQTVPTRISFCGRAWVYDLSSGTPGVPVATLTNPNPGENDDFGAAVAMSADFIVVGAPGDDFVAGDAGRVFVYNSSGQFLYYFQKVGQLGIDRFGESLAISGNRVVVGATGYVVETGVPMSGAAYVYDLSPGGATYVTTLKKPGAKAYDSFGLAVGISGGRVVVAGEMGSPEPGTAYVFDLSNGVSAMTTTRLRHPEPPTDDFRASSVAISGPVVAVGGRWEPFGAPAGGNVWLYDLAGATPAIAVTTLRDPRPQHEDWFGATVAASGSVLAVGAPGDDTLMVDKGYAYVFGTNALDQDADGLRDAWEMTHWSTTEGHSAADDFDHDGVNELLEAAFALDPKTPDYGALPGVVVEDNYLTITVTKQPGVTYAVQTAGSTGAGAFSTTNTTVLVNNATTLKVRDNVFIGTGPRRFMRVQVTAAP